MRYVFLFFLLLSNYAQSQPVIPFVDFNDFFKCYQDGAFRQLEFQPVGEYKASDKFIVYMDNRGNLRVYNGKKVQDLANLNVEYAFSDQYLVWKISSTLNLWEDGRMQTLTFNADRYQVMDSLVVYHDIRYNNVTVYQKGVKTPIYQATGDLEMPISVGDNTLVFKDNGDFFKIFWNGQITDIDVWVGKIDFSAGVDVVAWNDPNTRTFSVFEKGTIMDVEENYARSFKSGRGFVVYEDANGNLMKFQNGQKVQLSQFAASEYHVKDDIIVWYENNLMFMEENGKKWQVCNFRPSEFEMKNDVLVYRNALNGVSVSREGKVTELTNQQNAKYEIYGNAVLVKLFNRSYIVWDNMRKYEP